VKRSSDRNDGRRNIVQLTASGRRLYESLVPRVNAVGDRMLEPLAAAERRELVRLLAALVDAIDEQSAELEEIPSSRRSRAS
jgi:DNA-binding MarR family transcriptional regulator